MKLLNCSKQKMTMIKSACLAIIRRCLSNYKIEFEKVNRGKNIFCLHFKSVVFSLSFNKCL